MITKTHPTFLVLTAAAILGMPTASAELPMLDKQPWLGYYAVFANKRFNFTFTPQGDIEIRPINDKDAPVGKKLAITIAAGIEEILPDGKTIMKQVKAETLESGDAATGNLEKVTIRGKVTGDAEFELNIEQSRGIIFFGGRVLNPGTLTKNPLRFSVRVRIPNAYPDPAPEPGVAAKKIDKSGQAFLKKIKDDSLTVKWIDGKRVKQDFEKAVDATSKDINGPGIASAEIEISSYKGKRLTFTAAPNSAMTLRNAQPAPLHEGFMILWTADVTKDPAAKARLAIEIR